MPELQVPTATDAEAAELKSAVESADTGGSPEEGAETPAPEPGTPAPEVTDTPAP